jgi:integral membrane protein
MDDVTTPEPTTPAPANPPTPPTPAAPATATTPPAGGLRIDDVDGTRSRLTFFKVMAFVVGVGLIVLLVEMVLSYGVGLKGEENPLHWWPQPHGFIYMVYLVATALLGFKVGWSLTRMVLVMLAGCVPFLSFWVERRVAAEVGAGLAAARQ